MAMEEECECNCGEERVEWIYTYGDMVTLLLCFFILLWAMSHTETEKFKAVAASFKGGPPASPFQFTGMPTFMESIQSSLKKSDVSEVTDITVDDAGITVSFTDSVMFERGSGVPTQEGEEIIEKFSRILHAVPNRIIIEGHTDDVPVSGRQYPSNWELSSARASAVARLLEQFGIKQKRISVTGYASTKPKVANDTPELRRLNRRIDIMVKPEGF